MSESYRTSIRVNLVFIETQLPNASDGLTGERLVQLDNIDVL
jgi:hypothetical protein